MANYLSRTAECDQCPATVRAVFPTGAGDASVTIEHYLEHHAAHVGWTTEHAGPYLRRVELEAPEPVSAFRVDVTRGQLRVKVTSAPVGGLEAEDDDDLGDDPVPS